MSDPLMDEAMRHCAHKALMQQALNDETNAARKGYLGVPLTASEHAALEKQEMERRREHAAFLASLNN